MHMLNINNSVVNIDDLVELGQNMKHNKVKTAYCLVWSQRSV